MSENKQNSQKEIKTKTTKNATSKRTYTKSASSAAPGGKKTVRRNTTQKTAVTDNKPVRKKSKMIGFYPEHNRRESIT